MINRSLKQIISIALICIVTLPVLQVNLQAADSVIQAPDILDVKNPVPNTKIKGTINIIWRMYDNDQNVIPYTASLYDAQTCSVTNFGQINSNPNGNSSQTQDNILSWNTRTTLSNPNITDGNYCLKICVALRNGTSPYSACNGRNITIINNNRLPSITSIPSRLTIFENENWSYQIQATDPDGDRLSYRFISKPSWLDINSQTGLITSNGANKNPGNNDSVKYGVVVAVDDGLSGSVSQQFEITVRKVATTTPPSQNPNTPPPSTPTNDPTVINIESPSQNDVFEDDEITISWKILDSNGISNIKIEYSTNAEDWLDVTSIDSPTVEEYLWDTSSLEPGEYFLRITVTDNLNSVTSKTTPRFTIEERDVVEPPIDSIPLIINVSPLNNSEIESTTPQISGDFVPSEGSDIDPSTFEILLDGEDISDSCEVNNTGYTCTLPEELDSGLHQVEVKISDQSGKVANSVWTFSIKDLNPVSAPSDNLLIFGREISRGSLILALIIAVIVILLLTIPWILYILWKRKNDQSEEIKVEENSTINNNSVDNNYGYYIPPYNPIPVEPVSTEPYVPIDNSPSTKQSEYIETFQITPNVEDSTIKQAEPVMEMKSEENEPVMLEAYIEDQNLAKEDPKITPPQPQPNTSKTDDFVEPTPVD